MNRQKLKFPDTLHVQSTVKRLRTTKESLVDISRATGYSTRWLNAMRAGAIANPGVLSVYAIQKYFADCDSKRDSA